tara:strand:+ start:298 stop:447 length:150 start_codon:yes stop_codon:yes gene_type:complete
MKLQLIYVDGAPFNDDLISEFVVCEEGGWVHRILVQFADENGHRLEEAN